MTETKIEEKNRIAVTTNKVGVFCDDCKRYKYVNRKFLEEIIGL